MKARLPQGVGGGPGNMQSMIRQAQKMQEEMAATQQELETREYTANAGGGAVSATVNGKHSLTALTIQPEVIDPEDAEETMGRITGGMNLPGMF